MNKYIKYSVPIIISLSLFLGLVVYAEESGTKSVETKSVREIREGERGGVKAVRDGLQEQNKVDRSESEDVKTGLKDSLKINNEEFKTKLDKMVGDIKIKREEFKKELEANKELVKQKIEANKVLFKAKLDTIKDLKKKDSTEKIVTKINELNQKITSQLSGKVDQIEAVLVSIQSRIDKAESKGLNVALPNAQVTKAKETITATRAAIALQVGKSYESKIDEATLKTDMKKLRDTFKTDINAVNEKVKQAHVAVRNTATNLAKIPKIDEGDKDGLGGNTATGEVENTATGESSN